MKKIWKAIFLLTVMGAGILFSGCGRRCLRRETQYVAVPKQECTAWERYPVSRCLSYRYYTVSEPRQVCVEFEKRDQKEGKK